MENNNINKECWTKYTSFKILGIKLFEKEEILDSSQFEINKDFAFYSVPKCFKNYTQEKE